MDAAEVLDNSHMMIIQAVDHLPELEWDIPNVCGEWSVKEIIAHLTSYEQVLIDLFNTFMGQEPTPYMLKYINDGPKFNREEVEKRKYQLAFQVLEEYNDRQVEAVSLLEKIPVEKVRQPGAVPWYGQERCLADVIDIFYNHTCEHCAQITEFRNKVNSNK